LSGGLGAAQTQLQGSLVGPSLMANQLSKTNYNDLFNQLLKPSTMASFSTPSWARQDMAAGYGYSTNYGE